MEDLHRVVFKTKGAKGKVRKNLAAFAGFVFEDEAKEKPRLLDRLAKFKNGQITAMLDLCRVDRSAKSFEGKVDKDKLINRHRVPREAVFIIAEGGAEAQARAGEEEGGAQEGRLRRRG